jgi:hexosaminidase
MIAGRAAVCCALCFIGTIRSAQAEALPLVPLPAKITRGEGSFVLGATTRIGAPANLRAIAERFRDDLRPATGLPLTIGATGAITLALDSKLKNLGEEGYRLVVTSKQVKVRALAPAGIFYGLQTLRQLLPAAAFRRAPSAAAWRAPCVEIEDQPRFKWRGSHLDVGRHFMPKETIL